MTISTESQHTRLDLRQSIKVVVYVLLLVNFALYIIDDVRIASFTMRNGGTFLQWTSAFTTTIDESAWFLLLLLFELETYVLSDEIQNRTGVRRLVHAIRLVCYLSLAHSIYAFAITWYDLAQVSAIEELINLCELVSPDISFLRNLAYSDLTAANCGGLSTASQFYFTEPALVVTDGEGLALAQNLALVDLLEVIVWLLILFTIEVAVRLHDRSITRGRLISSIRASKLLLYTCLWGAAAYWLSLGHTYFAWDEALWIIGFFAIEMNVAEWKKEIEDEQVTPAD